MATDQNREKRISWLSIFGSLLAAGKQSPKDAHAQADELVDALFERYPFTNQTQEGGFGYSNTIIVTRKEEVAKKEGGTYLKFRLADRRTVYDFNNVAGDLPLNERISLEERGLAVEKNKGGFWQFRGSGQKEVPTVMEDTAF